MSDNGVPHPRLAWHRALTSATVHACLHGRWTDDNGVYHKVVSEVITFGDFTSSASGVMAADDGEDETVIDASGDANLSGPVAIPPLKFPLKFRVF